MAKKKWWQYLLGIFGPTGLVADMLVDQHNGSGFASALGGTEIANQLDSLINSKTGGHLTGAQQEANEFSARMAEEEYARQVEFYEKYQSPQALLRQGVNPFGVNGSTGSLSASGGSPSSVSPSAPSGTALLQLVSAIFGMQQQKKLNDSEVRLNSAQARLFSAEATGKENTNSVFGVLHNLSVAQIQSQIASNAQSIAESIQRVRESISRVSLNNSQIQVNGVQIDLMGSEKELNIAKTAVEKLNADKLSALMPYIKSRQEAEIALINAQTQEAVFSAEKAMYDANLSMLKGMVEADLIDQGYYDELVKQQQFETGIQDWRQKAIKRDYKWKPVNDVCSNISKIATATAAVIGSVTGVGGAIPTAAAMNYGSDAALGSSMYW